MMSPRRWILLLIFYISYLMFGASIYYHIEHNLEKENRATQLQERIEINEYLVDQLSTKNESAQNTVLERITNYCGKPVTNYTTDQYEEPYTWTFYHAFFFSFTVLSTVGYGNLAPTTTLGRMIMVVYSLIGIPINGILFSGLGDYFSKTFTSIYRRYKKYKMSNDIRYVPPQLGLLATVCIALVPGITFFIILPSLIFSYFESWSFATSVYYSYVTMTTIGFGDFVPTFQSFQPREFGGLFVVYQVFIIVWFIFSLGYLVMIMTFISKGLQSKKLSRLEYQLSENIKATQNRIWNGVTKDVGYLRRILNELYIMKFKPVYNEPLYFAQKRSISCPDLTMYRVDPPVISRKRAFSECYGTVENRVGNTPPFRTSSDTELSNINKQRTFETAESFKQTTDLLAQVVSALASIRPHEDELTLGSSGINGGYHGFTDSQILSSEWSFPPPGMNSIPQRERAFSDFNLHPRTTMRPGTNEWTWSGDNNQIQQAINIRCRNRHKSVFPGTMEHPGVVVDIDRDEETVNRQKRKFSMPDGGKQFFKKLIPFRKRSSQGLIDKNGVGDRKFSITSVPEVPPRINSRSDYYSTINIGQLDVKKAAPDSNNIHNMFANGGSGVPSILNRRNTVFDVAPRQESYQKSLPPQFAPPTGFSRKRRESLFTQNPNMRRSSMFPGGVAPNRRGSLFTDLNPRNTNLDFVNRRPSLFSVADEEVANQEILENTTIADLIRALEVMHTQAVLQQPVDESSNDKKRRKLGTAGIAPPTLSPIFSIFNPDDQPSTSGNRLYSRRSTIVGPALNQPTTTSILNRRRLSTVPVDHNDPPPSYTEKETPKFKRRFSVRPTNLQIPPGMAPPPPPMPSGLTGIATGANSNQIATQTALQRRLSLRPSPLARDANDGATSAIRGGMSSLPKIGSSGVSRMAVPPSSSSTHSPLSRIVQISQAQRKNSEQKDKDSK